MHAGETMHCTPCYNKESSMDWSGKLFFVCLFAELNLGQPERIKFSHSGVFHNST